MGEARGYKGVLAKELIERDSPGLVDKEIHNVDAVQNNYNNHRVGDMSKVLVLKRGE